MKKFFLLGLLLLVGTACNFNDLTSIAGGQYEGFIIKSDGDNRTQTFITAGVKTTQPGHYDITVNDQQQALALTVEINAAQRKITVSVPTISPTPFTVSKISKSCIQSPEGPHWAMLCYFQSEVSLDLKENGTSFTLIIDPRNNKNIPTEESPASYTKNQLIQRAINQSFTSRIEAERLNQFKLTAQNALGNLAPHFGTNTLIALLSPSLESMLKVIGDLVPFLMPNRWTKMEETKFAYQAEFNSWITIKADAGNSVEELSLLVLQLEEDLTKLKADEVEITQVRDLMKSQEDGILPIGKSDVITAVINKIDQTTSFIQEREEDGYASLAQASGFENPHAISKLLQTVDDTSVDNPAPYDPQQLNNLALGRSYELRQIDNLIQAAQKREIGNIFNWIDPNGDIMGELGLGFPSYVEIGKSEAQQVMIEGQKIQSVIQTQVTQAINELVEASKERTLAIEGRATENRIIARDVAQYKNGITIDYVELADAFEQRTDDEISMIEAGYRYLQAWSALNRLTYSGPYANLARGDMLIPTFDAELNSSTDQDQPGN